MTKIKMWSTIGGQLWKSAKPIGEVSEADSADSAMLSRVVQLSSQGLERAASSTDNDFTFIVNGLEIQCTQFQASFISPRVAFLVQQDKTINSFFIESLNRIEGIELKRCVYLFEQLMKGSGIVASGSELRGLCDLAAVLGNIELVNQFCDVQETNAQNVCSRLRKGDFYDCCLEEEICFAASHFYELEFEELKDLDICILETILSSPLLRLNDEDSLLEFICKVESDSRILVRQVFSEYLRSESMTVFLDFISGSNADPVIWSSLCRRLLLPIWRPPIEGEIPRKEAKSLDGIISYLTQKHGGNVEEKGIVTITSKSVLAGPLKNVADLTSDSDFWSKNQPGQWVCWHFGELGVRPTHYTIVALYLKSWVVEGSLDGRSWTEIDRKTDNQDFKFPNTTSFAVSNPAEFRFIRLTQTGKRHDGYDSLALLAVEFFGTLSE
jgi:hypothetical protein